MKRYFGDKSLKYFFTIIKNYIDKYIDNVISKKYVEFITGTTYEVNITSEYNTIAEITLDPGTYILIGCSQVTSTSNKAYHLQISTFPSAITEFNGANSCGGHVVIIGKIDKTTIIPLNLKLIGSNIACKNIHTTFNAIKLC